MAKKLKDYYNADYVRLLAEKLQQVRPEFDRKGFVRRLVRALDGKEFLERQDEIVDAFERFLGDDYTENITLFTDILGPELATEEGMFIHGWWLWPVGRYVERHGVKDFRTSMSFIYELTKRFTGEFAIRPLLTRYPKRTLRILKKWSKDKNVHVRRLASEGMRIRLPWAKKCLVALEEFESYKTILTNLRHDPSKFVQKSVGNNLNDLMKEAPLKAKEIIAGWERDSPSDATMWIIRHGHRGELKNVRRSERISV